MATLKDVENLLVKNQFDEAETLAKKLKIDELTRAAALASIAMKRGDNQKAEVLFEKVLAIDPSHKLALGNLGQLLISQGKHKAAIIYCKSAYELNLTSEVYALNYAACLAEMDRYKEAVAILAPFATDKRPSFKILLAYAALLRADLKPEEGLKILQRTQELYPNEPECERATADALAELDPFRAKIAFEKAEKNAKNPVAMRWNWSFVELRLGNFDKGWELYENGLSEKIGKIGRPLPGVVRNFELITNLEQIDKNKYTLFVCEQGIGDQILFLGCFREASQIYKKSILIAEERMIPILRRSFPEVEVMTYGFAYSLIGQTERINGVFPIGSIQKYFRRSREEYRNKAGRYISPNEKLIEKYQKILRDRANGRKLIGLSWTGGYWDRQKRTKSYRLEQMQSLFRRSDRMYVSLQYGDVSEEKEIAKKNKWPIIFIDGIDFKKDIDAWVALACATDRILSVSTAIVHFAGATGKKVDVLLGTGQAPFIWGIEDGESYAYKNVSTWRPKKDEIAEEFIARISDQIL